MFVKHNFMKKYKFHETLYEELMYKMLSFCLDIFNKNIRSAGFRDLKACNIMFLVLIC